METFALNYPKVRSLKGLKTGVVYQTTNYDMLKHPKLNRASEVGYVEKKVQEFQTLINCSLFMNDINLITVNKDGLIIEGNHRVEALKREKLPVPFYLNPSKRINGVSDEEILKVLIAYNGVRSNWDRNQAFDTALKLQMPLAIKITLLLDEIYNNPKYKGVVNKTNFQPSKIVGILTKNVDFIHGRKITIDLFNDMDLVKRMGSEEFAKELSFTLNIMLVLNDPKKFNGEIRTGLERILLATWKGMITKEKIYHYTAKEGFSFYVKPNPKMIDAQILEYSMKPFPRKLVTF